MNLDLGTEFGADDGCSTQRLSVFIPDKDREGKPIVDPERWVSEARKLLSEIGGGSTTFPPADGTWLDDKGAIIWEKTRIAYCYVLPEKFRTNLSRLREFLHRFGRETNQGEVVVEFDGRFFRIRTFDPGV